MKQSFTEEELKKILAEIRLKSALMKKELIVCMHVLASIPSQKIESTSFANLLTRCHYQKLQSIKGLVHKISEQQIGNFSQDALLFLANVTYAVIGQKVHSFGTRSLFEIADLIDYKEGSSLPYQAYFLDHTKRAALTIWDDDRVSFYIRQSYNNPLAKECFDTILIRNDRLITIQVVPDLTLVPRLNKLFESPEPWDFNGGEKYLF